MLNFKKIDSHKLSDQFGMSEDDFESSAKLWGRVQNEINAHLKDAMNPHGDDSVEYDASKSMAIFFKHFDNQAKQDVALVQFLMRDLSERAEHTARQLSDGGIKDMLAELKRKIEQGMEGNFGDEDTQEDKPLDETDFDELI